MILYNIITLILYNAKFILLYNTKSNSEITKTRLAFDKCTKTYLSIRKKSQCFLNYVSSV